MFDFDATCPHCEERFKLNRVGLEAKEFIQCPHCRGIIKLDLADSGKDAIRMGPNFVQESRGRPLCAATGSYIGKKFVD